MNNTALIAAAIGCSAFAAGNVHGAMRITEWMYNDVEYVEFTNIGATPIDMSGWSYDDEKRRPGLFDLSAFGVVQPAESVILAEDSADFFRELWGLDESIKVIGDHSGYGSNLGRNDEINLYDDQGNLVDRLMYGDNDYVPGSIRTVSIAGITTPEHYGSNDASQWFFAEVGDAYGSFQSAYPWGDTYLVGSPGYADVPEPAALSLLGVGGLLALRRRRAA